MSNLPVNPLSQEEQRRAAGQVWTLMEKQVESYHASRNMGKNSSVPAELAAELMESVEYTLEKAGGIRPEREIVETFRLGREVLERRLGEAGQLLRLVIATAPEWQTECRWEAMRCLRRYLAHYDFRHLAHRGPEGLFYPVLIPAPEGIRGIEECLFYLKVLWIENQIMEGFPEEALEEFWDALPPDVCNQCEPLLINALGKAILGSGMDILLFVPGELRALAAALADSGGDCLEAAAERLCSWLGLKDESGRAYVKAAALRIELWSRGEAGSPFLGV